MLAHDPMLIARERRKEEFVSASIPLVLTSRLDSCWDLQRKQKKRNKQLQL
jgi:hypothetical protein